MNRDMKYIKEYYEQPDYNEIDVRTFNTFANDEDFCVKIEEYQLKKIIESCSKLFETKLLNDNYYPNIVILKFIVNNDVLDTFNNIVNYMKFSILKDNDDYFYCEILLNKQYTMPKRVFYRCDQLSGLISLINDIKNIYKKYEQGK